MTERIEKHLAAQQELEANEDISDEPLPPLIVRDAPFFLSYRWPQVCSTKYSCVCEEVKCSRPRVTARLKFEKF